MNNSVMTNRVAIITGGASGMGKQIAGAFHENAFSVVINYLKSGAAARQMIKTMGDRAMAVMADVSRFDDVSRMAEAVRRQWGRVDVLINNAGIARDSLLIKQSENDWDSIMNVNLKGAFNCIRAFVPLMTGGGHIINISSFSGAKGKAGQAAYSASKAALLGLTKSAAAELGDKNIKVNAVLPGYMPTRMGINARRAMEEARMESVLNILSEPEEAADFVVYLAGTNNITGQIFRLDSRVA